MKFQVAVLIVALVGAVSSQGMRGFFERANVPNQLGNAIGGQIDNYANNQLGRLGNAGGNLGAELGGRFGGEMGRNLGQNLGNNMGNKLANEAGNRMGLDTNNANNGNNEEAVGCPVRGLISALRKDVDGMMDIAAKLPAKAAAAVNRLMKTARNVIEALLRLPTDPIRGITSVVSEMASLAYTFVENGAMLAAEGITGGLLFPNTFKFGMSLATKIMTNPMGFFMNTMSSTGYLGTITGLVTGSGPMSSALRMGLMMTPLAPVVTGLTMYSNLKNAGSVGGMVGLAGNALTGGALGSVGGLAGSAGSALGGALGGGAGMGSGLGGALGSALGGAASAGAGLGAGASAGLGAGAGTGGGFGFSFFG